MRFTNFIYFLILLIGSACRGGSESNSTKGTDSPAAQTDNLQLFKSIPKEQSGINFVNQITDTPELNFFIFDGMYQGAGVGVGDINNDGLTDIFFAGNQVADRLYLNKGKMTFEDISIPAGIGQDDSWSTGVAMADVNGDGWLDIYVCKFLHNDENRRKNKLYINNKNNTFTESAAAYGIADSGYSTQANFFDYDKDGDLDVYVCNQPPNASALRKQLGNDRHFQFTDRMYRNEGNNTFTDVTEAAGLMNYNFSLSVTVSDLNKDGWPDIYVGNDYEEPDFYYQNNGNGTFTDIAKDALRHMSNFTMGADIADFNNDGWPDIYTPDMVASDNMRLKSNMSGMNPQKFWALVNNGYHYQYMFNALQVNNGNGTFSEIAQMAGTSNTDWSWSALFTDLDNDGAKDLLVTNGLLKDMSNNDFRNEMKQYIANKQEEAKRTGTAPQINPLELLGRAPSKRISNYAYRNNNDLTFQDLSKVWGFDFEGWTQGAAFADLDNDGDIDVVTNNINDPASLFQNTLADNKINNFLRVKLKGMGKNPFAYGARVSIYLADETQQMVEVSPVRGFFSCSESVAHFGLGGATVVDRVVVDWPNGQQSSLTKVAVNQLLEVDQASAQNGPGKPVPTESIFTALSGNGLPFTHRENNYDDYLNEILLPYKLSHLGPKIAKGDVNKDGLEDLYFTGAAGQSGALYLQKKEGGFVEISKNTFSAAAASEETNALFFDADGDGDLDLYVTCGGNEFKPGDKLYQDRLYLNDGAGGFKPAPLPTLTGSHSVAAAGDMDGDGDLDLFIGNRNIPGRYGHTGESILLENNKGVFTKVNQQYAPGLANIGMVTDAAWFDYNKDGKADLVIAGEWMPISIFQNNGKGLSNATNDLGLQNTSGWWNALHIADMDKDGDMDLIAGNLGTNIKYKATEKEPFKLYVKDFDGNGSNDVYLGYYDQDGVCYPVRGRECSSQQMPFVKQEFGTYTEFASADIEKVLGSRKEGAILKECQLFESCYLENKDGKFIVRKLPNGAQISPIHGIANTDVNADGHLDLIVAGNYHQREVETTRSDAGIGSVLLGDGKGNFRIVHPTQSGLKSYGDVRDLVLVNSSGGHQLLVIGNNNAAAEVYGLSGGVLN
jgi:enediyne biosynthesis protein E4